MHFLPQMITETECLVLLTPQLTLIAAVAPAEAAALPAAPVFASANAETKTALSMSPSPWVCQRSWVISLITVSIHK